MMTTQTTHDFRYAIRIRGHLDETWSGWMDNWAIRHLENGETILSSRQPIDQSALLGILKRLQGLHAVILAVCPAE